MRNFLILFFIRAVALLPLSVARWLGASIGYCAWRATSRGAKVTRVNLSNCYPQLSRQELDQLVKERMIEWGKSLLEFPVVWGCSPQWLEKRVLRVNNLELIQQFRDDQQGVIIIAPHLGNWEVVGLHVAQYAPLTCMFAPTEIDALDNWVKAARGRTGVKLVPTNNRGVIGLLKALKAKEVLGILPDQVPGEGSGEFAPFFGRPALTMTLIHNLLQRTGAKAVFCYAKRVKGGFEISYQSAPEGLYSDKLEESLTALNQGIEQAIAGAVTQYQWEYKRYRKRPAGLDKLYTKENSQ